MEHQSIRLFAFSANLLIQNELQAAKFQQLFCI